MATLFDGASPHSKSRSCCASTVPLLERDFILFRNVFGGVCYPAIQALGGIEKHAETSGKDV